MKYTHIARVQYGDGSLAVRAMSDEGPVVLSVNLAQYGLLPASPDQFYVKDYSECAGLPKELTEQGIAHPVAEVFVGPFNSRCVLMTLNPA